MVLVAILSVLTLSVLQFLTLLLLNHSPKCLLIDEMGVNLQVKQAQSVKLL
jgi:hypothetical protein